MSINLHVVYKADGESSNRKEFYKPIITTGPSSWYAKYWEPVINRLNLEWAWLVEAAGIPLLQHLEQLPEIQGEFQQLRDAISSDANIPDEAKKQLLQRIELILRVIEDVCTNPKAFSDVYLG